jgi:hypothetical protein
MRGIDSIFANSSKQVMSTENARERSETNSNTSVTHRFLDEAARYGPPGNSSAFVEPTARQVKGINHSGDWCSPMIADCVTFRL